VEVPNDPPSTDSPNAAPGSPAAPALQMTIYQVVVDEMFRGHRPDGTGWDWSWAPWQRTWMDQTPNRYAYRCLPLTIANQTGWWLNNPVGLTATWDGQNAPGSVKFSFDSDPDKWSTWINNHFGQGIISWNIPFLFRTQPAGSRLLVCGPINSFKHGAQPLTAIIESDWMRMSFTMNWKITAPGTSVRFERGEPLLQVIPLATNIGADLETADVTYMRLYEDPEAFKAYHQWAEARRKFSDQKRTGAIEDREWQKTYFQGRDILGREVASGHKTKLTPPTIKYRSPKP